MRYANEEYNRKYWVITDKKNNMSKAQLDELPDGFYFVQGFGTEDEARMLAERLFDSIRGYRVRVWKQKEGKCVWSRPEKMEKE